MDQLSTLHTAELLAADLAGGRVDKNEAQKALAYLRSKRDPKQFFAYLQAITQNGRVVIRSNRTLGYYKELLNACERHLRGKNAEEMLLTLGWAIRLLAYYQQAPENAPQRSTEQVAPPEPEAPPQPSLPERPFQVGDRFRGTITKVLRSGHVFLQPSDVFVDTEGESIAIVAEQRSKADVVIPAESHSGKGMKAGNARWVEVVEIHESGDKLLIEVKPTPSPVKKGS
jgi:hypothetical protein